MEEPTSIGLLLGVVAVLILLSGFFSSSETGMMALNRYRLKHLAKTKHRGARLSAKLLEEPESLISLILIGNNLVNIAASSIATVIAIRLLGEGGIWVATLVLTLVVLLFAEIMPKTIAAYHPERVAFTFAHVLYPLRKLMTPVIWVVNGFTHFMLRLTGVESGGDDHLSQDELRTILGESGHLIPKRHRKMLLNILDLEQVTVEDIMIPRSEVFGVDLEMDAADIIDAFRNADYTRIPVYEGELNNIIGVLHQRDINANIASDGSIDKTKLLASVRKPYFIPEGTPLNTQLFNFQKHKRRMGVVVDEYGIMQGIVTLEDLLEEIVGEFTSNIADLDKDIEKQPDGTYLIDGTATIREINRALDWHLPTDGPKTLNGLLVEELESIPEAMVGLAVGRYRFEIVDVKDNLIQHARAFDSKARKR